MKLQMNNENICTVNELNKPYDRRRKREIYPVDSIASVGYVQWKVESVEVTICRQREREAASSPTALAIYYARQSVISVLLHLHLPQSSSSSSV